MLAQAIDVLLYLEPALCVIALAVLIWRAEHRRYLAFAALLVNRLLTDVLAIAVLQAPKTVMSQSLRYDVYFYVYWLGFASELLIDLWVIYSLYELAMEPLSGLKQLGRIVFRWASGIAVLISLSVAMGSSSAQTRWITRFVLQLDRTQCVLSLCMLTFVCIAIRPMGLSHRSRIFGVSLGLATMATVNLVLSSWVITHRGMEQVVAVLNGLNPCLTFLLWIVYFILPEPERKMILIPTTSPYHHWNEISLAMGDNPGVVAVGTVGTDIFHPAELEALQMASIRIGEQRKLEQLEKEERMRLRREQALIY